jgi:ribosomal protein S18 acetylase RimI-like enzyme
MNRVWPSPGLFRVSIAECDEDITNCYETMRVLRTELSFPESFLTQVKHQQMNFGYVLLTALVNDASVVGVAGFRPQENLMHGLHLYVDDLVILEAWRNRGVGAALMDAVVKRAHAGGYRKILLDTGMLNEAAHRFYVGLGFAAKAIRFSLDLAHNSLIGV